MANVLPDEKRLRVLAALVDGNSERAVERMTEVNRRTVSRLLLRLGEGGERLHDRLVRDLRCGLVQVDEQFSYVGKKEARVTPDDPPGIGETYTFTGIDASSRLVISWRVGRRDQALPARLGTQISPERVKLGLLAVCSEPAHVELGARLGVGGLISGWRGDIDLVVSPLARWLLECAARIGLGGRTAFGFGRVTVTDLRGDDRPMLPPDPVDLMAPRAVDRAAATWGVPPDEAARRLSAVMERGDLRATSDDGSEIRVADGLRLVVVPWLGDQRRVEDVARQ